MEFKKKNHCTDKTPNKCKPLTNKQTKNVGKVLKRVDILGIPASET